MKTYKTNIKIIALQPNKILCEANQDLKDTLQQHVAKQDRNANYSVPECDIGDLCRITYKPSNYAGHPPNTVVKLFYTIADYDFTDPKGQKKSGCYFKYIGSTELVN